ncbi:ribbon-helix-helix protein, CopG family [bacterium]|nr:ribbon-helix-helix protein, CopG family [bacterium]
MIRTQIYLPENIHKRLLALRGSQGKSLAQIIREAIEKQFAADEPSQENDILKLADLKLKGGPKDLSKNIDQYLYGEK